MPNLECIKGIGRKYLQQLDGMGLKTTSALLERGALPRNRKELSAKLGVNPALILNWVIQCDFFRLKGMKPEYVDVILAADITTVNEMACFDTETLYGRLTHYGNGFVSKLPSEKLVSGWIDQAGLLPPIIWFDGLYCYGIGGAK
ncbi:DUF4332 domain-containing protein [candidate division WOR-3 bacterium]|nr:DUF4332 domain-containing protein [candidate division WOR-3 bacterium]